jgi:hypothetical protein
MAWTTPKSWTSSMVTSTDLNAQIKANEDVLSAHAHSGAAGNGSATLSGVSLTALEVMVLAAPGGSPSTAGQLRRVGNNLEYYGAALVGLYADGAAGVATLRTLGTGSAQAAAGNHTH